jgi:hypothetical protein
MADRAVLHIAAIQSADDLRKFSTDPLYPQVVYLHGSVGRYQDRNLEEETKALDPDIREAVLPDLRAAGPLDDTPLDTRLAEEKLNAYAQTSVSPPAPRRIPKRGSDGLPRFALCARLRTAPK